MNTWESFAKEAAEYYILTVDDSIDYSTKEGQEYFFSSGRDDCADLLEHVRPHLPGTGKALEIGCGIGRLALAHAELFDEVVGVDISETMLKKLNLAAAKRGTTNVTTYLSHEPWDQPDSCDYVYSYIVFQHIEHFGLIVDYVRRIAQSLKAQGIAQLQFDTRRATFSYRLRNMIPDFVLPRPQRRGIRRIRRRASQLRKLFQNCGLQIVSEHGPDSELHHFVLRNRAMART